MSRPNWQVRCWGWRRAYAFRGGLSVDWCSARFPRRLQRSRRRPPPLAAAPLAAPPAGCCLPPAGANLAVPVPVCPAAKYESEAGRYWDLFYKRNEVRGRAAKVAGVCLVGSWCLGTCGLQADGLLPDLPRSFFRPVPFTLVIPASIYIQDRFFKDRHYFGREWPQLLSAQHVLEVGPSPGRLLTSRACRKDGRQLATARRVLEAVPQLMRRFFCSPPAAHALVHRPLSLSPPPPPPHMHRTGGLRRGQLHLSAATAQPRGARVRLRFRAVGGGAGAGAPRLQQPPGDRLCGRHHARCGADSVTGDSEGVEPGAPRWMKACTRGRSL